MTMTMLTEEQADRAARAADSLLGRLLSGAKADGPLEPPVRQVFAALAGIYLGIVDAALRLSPTPLAPVLPEPAVRAFDDYGAAESWYRANARRLTAFVQRTGEEGLDELCFRLYVSCEPLMVSAYDVATWREMTGPALAAARRLGDPADLARTLLAAGGMHKMADQPDEAVAAYDEAARILADLGDTASLLVAANRRGAALVLARRLDEAGIEFDRVLAVAGDDPVMAGLALINRCAVLHGAGRFDEAVAAGLEGAGVLRAAGASPVWLLAAAIELTEAATGLGDLTAAEHHSDDAHVLIRAGAPARAMRIGALVATGGLRIAQGRYDDARQAYSQAMVAQIGGSPHRTSDIGDGLGRAHLGLGDGERAVAVLSDVLAARRRATNRFATARTLRWLAAAQDAVGDTEQAADGRAAGLRELAGIVDPAADQLRAELSAG
jgi:tetratricopeptide (TPR) repeat protein